jgi:hypothetical protein
MTRNLAGLQKNLRIGHSCLECITEGDIKIVIEDIAEIYWGNTLAEVSQAALTKS